MKFWLHKIVFEKYLVTIQIQHFTFPSSRTSIQLCQVSQVDKLGELRFYLLGKHMQAPQFTNAPIFLLLLWIYRVWLAPSLTI